jgi:hydrogenase maturation factor
MNLLYGQIVEIASEDGMRVGKIRVAGAFKKVSLELLGEAQIGDRVLVCDGIAISKDEPLEPPRLSEQLLSSMQGQYSSTPTIRPPDSRARTKLLTSPVQGSVETNLCV